MFLQYKLYASIATNLVRQIQVKNSILAVFVKLLLNDKTIYHNNSIFWQYIRYYKLYHSVVSNTKTVLNSTNDCCYQIDRYCWEFQSILIQRKNVSILDGFYHHYCECESIGSSKAVYLHGNESPCSSSKSTESPDKTVVNDVDSFELKKSSNSSQIECVTRGQTGNKEWHRERRNRLTASNFGRVCKLKATTSTVNLVKSLLYCPLSNTIEPLKYGKETESHAIARFEMHFKVRVEKTGLIVDKNRPYLAASPDGFIANSSGCVEVKCPYTARDMTIPEAIEKKAIKYCDYLGGNAVRLRRNHNYMYQIQGQLHITNRDFCYFFIYTRKDFAYERIARDDAFWKERMEPILEKFYYLALQPEILESHHKRNLPLRDIRGADIKRK